MKTVGIIGGLGPKTTTKFYLELIKSCYKENKINRPPILIWSVPLKYQLEEEVIIQSKDEEKLVPYLVEGSKKLESGEADFLVIPCNSVHVFIEEVRNSVKIPVLSIIDETVRFLTQNEVKEVGLLATKMTIKNDLYQSRLEKVGIKIVLLDDTRQERLGEIISKLVMDNIKQNEKQEFLDMIKELSDDGRRSILLSCTDLQLAVGEIEGIRIYDTMKILADATVREILS